jgi:hypothetical protein
MSPSVRNRLLGMVSPRRGLGKESRRIPSDGGQGLYTPFFNTLAKRDQRGHADHERPQLRSLTAAQEPRTTKLVGKT